MRITIDNTTTLSDLSRELQNTHANERLRAKRNDDGTYTLYTRTKDTSARGVARDLKETFLGKTGLDQDKKRLAQMLVRSVIRHQIENDKTASAQMRKAVGEADTAITEMHKVMEFTAKQFDKVASNKAGRVTDTIMKLSQFHDTVLATLRPFANVTKADIPALPPTQNRVLPGVETVTRNGKDRDFPDLQIDGKTFKAMAVLGEGGQGTVVRYKSADKDVRAVKFMQFIEGDDLASHRQNASKELHTARAMTTGNTNASGFTDYVELSDQTIALIGDPLPNGDVAEMGETLHAALAPNLPKDAPIPKGKITAFEKDLISLTLIKDIATGLAIINDDKDSVHGDMKAQNVMLDRNGTAQLIDFGSSAEASEVLPLVYEFPVAPIFVAPEVKRQQTLSKQAFGIAPADVQTMLSRQLQDLFDGFKMDTQTRTKQSTLLDGTIRFISKILAPITEFGGGLDSVKIDKSRYDSYGLGTIAVELVIGGSLGEDIYPRFQTNLGVRDEIDRWAQTGADALGPNGLRNATSGDPAMDRFINDMLRPDPSDRLSTAEIRDHKIMQRAGVGSPEVRELVKALAGGNADQIDQARDALRKKFAP